jgi:hypothetical protein
MNDAWGQPTGGVIFQNQTYWESIGGLWHAVEAGIQ